MKSVLQILTQARRLVEKGWTQGHGARDDGGIPVNSNDRNAVCWCPLGAFSKVCGGSTNEDFTDAMAMFMRAINTVRWISVIRWNDQKSRTKAQVLSAFDRAIALARRGK